MSSHRVPAAGLLALAGLLAVPAGLLVWRLLAG